MPTATSPSLNLNWDTTRQPDGPCVFNIYLLDRGLTAGRGGSFVAPAFLRWLFLRRGYRGSPDRNLTGLAAPAWVLGWCMWIGGAFSLLFLFWRP